MKHAITRWLERYMLHVRHFPRFWTVIWGTGQAAFNVNPVLASTVRLTFAANPSAAVTAENRTDRMNRTKLLVPIRQCMTAGGHATAAIDRMQ